MRPVHDVPGLLERDAAATGATCVAGRCVLIGFGLTGTVRCDVGAARFGVIGLGAEFARGDSAGAGAARGAGGEYVDVVCTGCRVTFGVTCRAAGVGAGAVLAFGRGCAADRCTGPGSGTGVAGVESGAGVVAGGTAGVVVAGGGGGGASSARAGTAKSKAPTTSVKEAATTSRFRARCLTRTLIPRRSCSGPAVARISVRCATQSQATRTSSTSPA
jgi:hypothetical protein